VAVEDRWRYSADTWFPIRMADQPPEQVQRRIDRLRARRAELAKKEQQQTVCAHDKGSQLLAQRARNGAIHVYTGCQICHANLEGGRFHPAGNIDVTVLPVGMDRHLEGPPCQVCGEFGTELHHWAPTAIFGLEASAWPTAYLCTACHQEWHRRMEVYRAAQAPQLFSREA
jgi:uncharacterized CHY-type Zn-finger protein